MKTTLVDPKCHVLTVWEIPYHVWTKTDTSAWRLTFSFFRFGKHRKDEQPEDKMEKKGSTKSKTEDVEEKTQDMRLEKERWVVQFSWLENLLNTQLTKWLNKVWVVFESTPTAICGIYTSILHKDHL